MRHEKGQIIPIVAGGLFCFLVFIAFVVDLSIFSNSWEQTQHYSRLAALSALEQHFATTGTETVRANAALARAKEVTGRNFMLSDPSKGAALAMNGTVNPGAKLTPGRYYFGATCAANTPACDPCKGHVNNNNHDTANYPCFIDADLTNPAEKVTAYRVQGELYNSISARFARVAFGDADFPVNVFAISTVRPRQVCALIDVSGSMMRTTHPFRRLADQAATPKSGHGSTPLFTPPTLNASVVPTEPNFMEDHWKFLRNQLAAYPGQPTRASLTSTAAWDTFLGGSVATVTAADYQRMHFWDDYRQIVTLKDSDYGALDAKQKAIFYSPNDQSLDAGMRALIAAPQAYTAFADVYRSAGDNLPGNAVGPFTYAGPEPMRTVFAGLKTAVEYFKARDVAGDKMCIIFYNKSIPWMSFMKLSDDFETIEKYTNFADYSSIPALAAAPSADPFANAVQNRVKDFETTGAKGYELIVRSRMMPLGTNALFTNTLQALTVAANELEKNNPDGSVTQSIVLIGDGLGNCFECPNPMPSTLPAEYQICSGQPAGSTQCDDGFEIFDKSQRNILNWVAASLAQRNIPLHTIIVGSKVQPHTLNMKKPGTTECLSDEQARQMNVPMVRGGFNWGGDNIWSCKGACAPSPLGDATKCTKCQAAFKDAPTFLQSNEYLYEMSAGTNGLWGPIRPKSPSCPSYSVDCSSSPEPTNWTTASEQIYDPDCKTEEEQINSYMEKVIGGNPFTLVEVDHN